MPGARQVLQSRGLRAKKALGQNFLCDLSVQARIVAAARLDRDDVVVEIGAGLGALTGALAAVCRRVIAIERDPDLVAVLREDLPPAVEVYGGDALDFDLAQAARDAGRPVVVVGNLPYNVTSPLLFHVAGAGTAVARAVVMVQREVAQRIVAPPGSKTYGRLSVMLQQSCAVDLLFHVRPGAFLPRPAVTSTVIRMAPRAALLSPVRDAALFDRVVREAFGTRRKMLRRALEPAFGAAAAAAALARAGIDGTRRAETLHVAELAGLADAFLDEHQAPQA